MLLRQREYLCLTGAPQDDEGDKMAEVRKLKCATHGSECDENPRHAHSFRWVTLRWEDNRSSVRDYFAPLPRSKRSA